MGVTTGACQDYATIVLRKCNCRDYILVGMRPEEEHPTESTTSSPDANARGTTGPESALVEALRSGSEDAFASLVDKYYAQMLRLAMMYVSSRAVA